MEDLRSFDFSISSPSHAWRPLVHRRLTPARGGVPRRSVGVMAVHQCAEELHEDVPDLLLVEPAGRHARPFGLAGGPLDERGEVTAAAELHQNIEGTSVAVDHAVVVANDVLMMEVFEDVDLSDDLALVALGHEREVEVLSGEDLEKALRARRGRVNGRGDDGREYDVDDENKIVYQEERRRTAPSVFRRTFRMTPKEPLPITSRDSNCSSHSTDMTGQMFKYYRLNAVSVSKCCFERKRVKHERRTRRPSLPSYSPPGVKDTRCLRSRSEPVIISYVSVHTASTAGERGRMRSKTRTARGLEET
jgi:hypothetical protein